MANVKLERLNHLIQQEISIILMEEVRDEDLKFVTITGCDTSSDYSYCKVYFTVLDEEKKATILEALDGASSFIRSKLAERIDIRHTPEFRPPECGARTPHGSGKHSSPRPFRRGGSHEWWRKPKPRSPGAAPSAA